MRKIRVIAELTVMEFANSHANVKKSIINWLVTMKTGFIDTPQDFKKLYPNSNLFGEGRIIFDINGNGKNAVRFICYYFISPKTVHLYICWMGTHEEYNHLTDKQKNDVWDY